MSHLLFIDESGHDQRDSPFEVLAGVAVEDSKLWPLIREMHRLEHRCFGRRYADGSRELKGKKILKRKVFRQAGQRQSIPRRQRAELACRCLTDGDVATGDEITALAQAKLDFVARALRLFERFGGRAVATIVPRGAPRPGDEHLRKDYAYLFERFWNLLDEKDPEGQGLVVFDELERSQGHLLVEQMGRYFTETRVGRKRSARVIPEPFFVHSHLTTGVQLADLVAYIAAWGMSVGSMPDPPARPELATFGRLVARLEHHYKPSGRHDVPVVHGFSVIRDLRTRRQQRPSQEKGKGNVGPRAPQSLRIRL